VTTPDRRAEARKQLPPDFVVELHPLAGGPPLIGRVEDLTVAGAGVVLAAPIDPADRYEVWAAHLPLPAGPLELACVVTHEQPRPDGWLYGLSFYELREPARATDRAALRQFLMGDLRASWSGIVSRLAPIGRP